MAQNRHPFREDKLNASLDEALRQRMAVVKRAAQDAANVGDVNKARDDFEYYYRQVFCNVQPGIFPWGPHQRFVLRFITWQGWRGVFPTYRLVVMPPGTGKSNIVSKALTSWLVGKYPHLPTCLATATSRLAIDRSIYLREFVRQDDLYKVVFPGLSPYPAMWTNEQWTLLPAGVKRHESSEPTFRCTGADASIGGIRIQHAVVDDVHNLANSRTTGERERIKDWYHTQFVSRMQGMINPFLIMLANVWHGDDLTSTLWEGKQYAVMHMMALYDDRTVYCDVTLPDSLGGAGPELADWCGVARERWTWMEKERRLRMVIHRHGPALWPKRIPSKSLQQQRKANPPRFERVWNGRRKITKGTVYVEENFKYWDADKPPNIRYSQQVWDTAAETNKRSDYTAGILQHIGHDGNLYVADVLREKLDPGLALPLAIASWYLYALLNGTPVRQVLIENSAYARTSIAQIRLGWTRSEFLRHCNTYLRSRRSVPSLNKIVRYVVSQRDNLPSVIKIPVRALPIRRGGKSELNDDASVYYATSNVYHLSTMDKLALFESELKDFPDGANDDMVDANAHGIVYCYGVRKPQAQPNGGHMLLDLSPVFNHHAMAHRIR